MIPIDFEVNWPKVKVTVTVLIHRPNLVGMMTRPRIDLGLSNLQTFALAYR